MASEWRILAKARTDFADLLEGLSNEPVSYTHLTLPTICSV